MGTRVVIVGAGHAGGTAAALLRQFGWEGEVVVVGEEPAPPYQRPPLSKAYLKGEADLESLKLKQDAYYAENQIELMLGSRVDAVDVAAKTVTLHAGAVLSYDWLILATGSLARRLPIPGADAGGIAVLRTAADAEAIKAALTPGRKLAVVGAGYVGLEVAASARALGASVTVLEREARVLARVASAPLAEFFAARHRSEGVEILTGVSVTHFTADAGGFVNGVALADGRVVACDAALVGVGGVACDGLARAAALPCENGIRVDHDARTADPSVFAIGDVAFRPMPLYGDRMFRLESVPNALEQAKQAVSAIMGRPAPAPEVPWFWSDQYDIKLQIAGVAFEPDLQVVRGDAATGKFSVWHLREGRVLCVEAVNAPAEFMIGKKLVQTGRPADPEKIRDASVSPKELAAD